MLVLFLAFGLASAPPIDADRRAAEAAEAALDEALDAIYTETGYRWYAADARSVQYGVPDTDDRAFRIDCRRAVVVEVMFPAATEAPEGTAMAATFAGGASRPGQIRYLGDGANLAVPLGADDPVLDALFGGERVRIVGAGASISVPAEGAAQLIRPLLAACRTPS